MNIDKNAPSTSRSANSSNAKENIHVYLRFRPISKQEEEAGDLNIWEMDDQNCQVNIDTYNDLVAQNSKKLNFVITTNKVFSYSKPTLSSISRSVL